MPFKKGVIQNPNGRKKGSHNKRTELMNAIKFVQGRHGKKLLVHAVEQAYVDNKVLVALLKKFIPDMKYIEGSLDGNVTIEIVKFSKGKVIENNTPE